MIGTCVRRPPPPCSARPSRSRATSRTQKAQPCRFTQGDPTSGSSPATPNRFGAGGCYSFSAFQTSSGWHHEATLLIINSDVPSYSQLSTLDIAIVGRDGGPTMNDVVCRRSLERPRQVLLENKWRRGKERLTCQADSSSRCSSRGLCPER